MRSETEKQSLLELEVAKNSSSTLPQVSLNAGGFLNDFDRADQSLNFLPWYNLNAGMRVDQKLFSATDQSTLRISQEKARIHAEDINLKREMLQLQFAQAYLRLCYAKIKENASRNLLGRVRNVYDVAKRLSTNNPKIEPDVLSLEAELQRYKNNVLNAQSYTRQVEIALNQAMWIPLDISIQVAESDLKEDVSLKELRLMEYMEEPKSFPLFSQVFLELGLESNSDLLLQRSKKYLSRMELEESRNNQLDPEVGAYAIARWNFLQASDERFEREAVSSIVQERDNFDWTAGVYMEVPIFDGFYKKNQISQKFGELVQEEKAYEAQKRTLESDIRKQLIELNTRYRGIAFNQKAEESALKSFEKMLLLYERGEVGLSDVLAVHSLANDSYFSYLDSLFAFRLAFVSSLGKLGMLDYYTDNSVSDKLFSELDRVYQSKGFRTPKD